MRINEAHHDDRREAEGKIVQKIDVAAGRARRSAPRCRFQLSHGVGEANFPIQFPDGSHKGLFMKRSPRVEASTKGRRQNAREMNGEDETFALLASITRPMPVSGSLPVKDIKIIEKV